MTDGEGPPPDDFDYGEKGEDGQYENYPTIDEGEFEQPVRRTYRHEECDTTTSMREDIAESVARDPEYYSKTFCHGCGKHVPVDEVHWEEDGADWVIDESDGTEATLRFDGDDVDQEKVREACELLREAGVTFDTGIDVVEDAREWHLDWSLDGATLKGRNDDE